MVNEIKHTFDSDEFLSLSRDLEKHHSVFYRLWNMGKPIFTDEISTAAVQFDKLGDSVNFLINYDFWQKQSETQKQFIICHESLHIILNHGLRIKDLSSNDLGNANKALDIVVNHTALDIVVNHTLIERFNFDRKDVDPNNIYCWVDTVFDKLDTIPLDKAYEFYYNLISKQQESGESGSKTISGGKILDDHNGLQDFDKIIKRLSEELSAEEKEALKGTIQKHYAKNTEAGSEAGSSWIFVNIERVKTKKKWESVIKKWSAKHAKDKEEEQWARKNRRLACLDDSLILPTDAEVEDYDKDKIDVCFFQDTSGSCYHLANRFFTAAKTLLTERFNVRLFCFDTKVYPTSLKDGKLFGFGGTTFSCIENYIQQEIKKTNCKYPAAIFVISDGMGNHVHPAKPKNWYWFLSHNYTNYIPKESKIFMLKDYE
jgi:predicted metal-dependent peptidase